MVVLFGFSFADWRRFLFADSHQMNLLSFIVFVVKKYFHKVAQNAQKMLMI